MAAAYGDCCKGGAALSPCYYWVEWRCGGGGGDATIYTADFENGNG